MQESQIRLTSFLAKQRVETDRIMVNLILFVSLGLLRRLGGGEECVTQIKTRRSTLVHKNEII